MVPGRYGRNTLSAVLAASDVAWLGYERFYSSSSVLCEAAQAGIPLLGTPLGWIGDRVRRTGIGLVVDTRDPDAVVRCMLRLVEPGAERTGFIDKAHLEGRKHTQMAFGKTVCDAIELAMTHEGVREEQ